MRQLSWEILSLSIIAVASAGAQKTPKTAKRAPIVAQRLVDDFVRGHTGLSGLEVALTSATGCTTVASSASEDVGEKCDADELGPIRTGNPDVEEPSKADPVYDITQALHDASGHLIGAVGMDLKPDIGSRETVVARARQLLGELESKIPSKARLLERSSP